VFARAQFHELLDRLYCHSPRLRNLAAFFSRRSPAAISEPLSMDFDQKLEQYHELFANDAQTWASLASQMGAKLHYVLQPVAGWTDKPLTTQEAECFAGDVSLAPWVARYSNRQVYLRHRDRLAKIWEALGVAFSDANQWWASAAFAGRELLSDVCHLTDEGAALAASELKARLDWKVAEHRVLRAV
jgi:hypothetical protein